MLYFTKRSTRQAFSGLSEMFSISRHKPYCHTPHHTTDKGAACTCNQHIHFNSNTPKAISILVSYHAVPKDLIPIICFTITWHSTLKPLSSILCQAQDSNWRCIHGMTTHCCCTAGSNLVLHLQLPTVGTPSCYFLCNGS
jgi:hypothetical protein